MVSTSCFYSFQPTITSSPQRHTHRQTTPYPSEGPDYDHHHGPGTHNLWRGGDSRYIGGGGDEDSLTYDEGGRREDHQPEPSPDTRHRERGGVGEYGERSRGEHFDGRGKYQNPPHDRYHNQTGASTAEFRQGSSGGSGSSSRRSNGRRRGMIHAQGGQANNSVEVGRDRAKHVESSGGPERYTNQKVCMVDG